MTKYLFILLTILSFTNVGFAQTLIFNNNWNNVVQLSTSNGFSHESRKVVVNNANGDSYMLADFTSDLDLSGNVTGNIYNYVALLRFDSQGNFLDNHLIDVGQHRVTGQEFKSGFGLELDQSGNVYVGYMSYDSGTSYDVNLAKYSSNLNPIWTYTFNKITDDNAIDMKVSPSGHIYAIVKSLTVGTTNFRYNIIKASGGGTSSNVFFTYNFGLDIINSLAIDNNSNLFITGYRLDGGVKAIHFSSISPSGNLRWVDINNCGTNSGDDIGKHISFGNDGFIYVTGSSVGTVQHGIDAVTIKYDPSSGKKVWENFINYTLSDGGFFVYASNSSTVFVSWTAGSKVYVDQINGITGQLTRRAEYAPTPNTPVSYIDHISISDMKVSQNNVVYLTGTVNAANTSSLLFDAVFLIKVNFLARGNSRIESEVQVSGSHLNSENSSSIALDPLNNNVLWLHDETQTYSTHAQELINLSSLTQFGTFRSINNDETALNPFVSVSPIPANNIVNIVSDETILKVLLTSIDGKAVQNVASSGINSNHIQIKIDQLSAGLYFALIEFENGTLQTTKVIIE